MVITTNDGYIPSPPGTPLKVYLLTQRVNNRYGTYDSCVVIAASKGDARRIHPQGDRRSPDWKEGSEGDWSDDTWVSKSEVGRINVTEIGTANAKQVAGHVVCNSFC